MASSNTDKLHPTVFSSAPLADLIYYVLYNHSEPTSIIVCNSDRTTFVSNILFSAKRGDECQDEIKRHPLLSDCLQALFASETVKVAFCPSIHALHAYLTTFPKEKSVGNVDERNTPLLVIIDSIAAHRDTTTFSAQGLGKTFAAAVEAAARGKQRLILFESNYIAPLPVEFEEDVEMQDEDQPEYEHEKKSDIWLEEVPIINVSTKTFGAGHAKNWMDKKVKIVDVAGRWCIFENIPRSVQDAG